MSVKFVHFSCSLTSIHSFICIILTFHTDAYALQMQTSNVKRRQALFYLINFMSYINCPHQNDIVVNHSDIVVNHSDHSNMNFI